MANKTEVTYNDMDTFQKQCFSAGVIAGGALEHVTKHLQQAKIVRAKDPSRDELRALYNSYVDVNLMSMVTSAAANNAEGQGREWSLVIRSIIDSLTMFDDVMSMLGIY